MAYEAVIQTSPEDGYILCSDLFYGTCLRISGSNSCIESHISICAKLTSADALQFQIALAHVPGISLSPFEWVALAFREGTPMARWLSRISQNCWEISTLIDNICRHLMQIITNNSNLSSMSLNYRNVFSFKPFCSDVYSWFSTLKSSPFFSTVTWTINSFSLGICGNSWIVPDIRWALIYDSAEGV